MRCSTARRTPSIRRVRARTHVARSRSSSRTRRASGCTSRPRLPAFTSAFTRPPCARTVTGRGWPTGGSRRRSACRGTRSVSDPRSESVRRFLAGRLAQAAIVVFLVTTVTFVLIHLAPGDPIATALNRPGVTEAVRQQYREDFGLDRPLGEQYFRWLNNAARGDLGWSISFRRPVRDVIADALPRTLLLVGLAIMFSFALGIIVAVLQTERPGGRRDTWLGRILLLLYSVPDFWLALVVLLIFAYRLPLFPSSGIV